MHNGAPAWTTRVVVGKPGKQATPELTETMKFITVNPTWNVPPSIVYNEYLPALQQDPTVLERMGLRLSQNRDGSVHISQPPGAGNALGRIRFNFPNRFLVYQHDTPDKHLFAHDTRAYSHGCMRVQNPDNYAETLLSIALPKENYSAARIKSMYGKSEIDIRFPTPIPVHIVYHTAFVDDAGHLQTRKDVYARDSRLLEVLRSGDRQNMEVAINHAKPSYGRPPATLPPGVAGADSGYSGGSSGRGFFETLFGIPSQPPPPQRPQRRVPQRQAAN
jgi:murein L,D-transpeptidase YcbB/YkuD